MSLIKRVERNLLGLRNELRMELSEGRKRIKIINERKKPVE